MKRRILLLTVICLLCLLSGCQQVKETAGNAVKTLYEYKEKPEAESVALKQTTMAEYNSLSVPSEKYKAVLAYQLTGIQGAALYQFQENEEQQEVYSVLCYATSAGASAEIEFIGLKSLSNQCGIADGAVVLSTSDDTCRLYVQKLSFTEEMEKDMENSMMLSWVSGEDYNLVYQGGFYDKTKTDNGCRIVYEVENMQWKGYTTVFCDNVAKQSFQVTYVEHNSCYDAARAKETIYGVSVPDSVFEQAVTELTVERRELDALSTYPADYFTGSDYALSRLYCSAFKETSDGAGSLIYSCDGTEHIVSVNIVDTLAPEVTYLEDAPEVVYFMTEASVSVGALAEQFFTAADESGTVFITLSDGREELLLSEEEFEPGVPKNLEIYVTDRFGNRTVAEFSIGIVQKERIPTWYDTFFDGTWDDSAVEVLNKLICNPECKQEDYLQHLYEEKQVDKLLTEEMMAEAMRGMERMAELEIEVTITDSHADISNVVLFYANMANMPAELLQLYVQDNVISVGYGDAWPIKSFDEFVVTEELQNSVLNGMKKAEEAGFGASYGGISDIMEAAKFFLALGNCDESSFAFCKAYESSVNYGSSRNTVVDLAEFLYAVQESPQAVEGYERLKTLGIDVTLESKEDASDILKWFAGAAKYPESLVQIYVEQEWDVTVPEDLLSWYLLKNTYILTQSTMDALEQGLSMVTEAGLVVEYPEQLTFFELAQYYEEMCRVPVELLKLCAEKDAVWYMSTAEVRHIANQIPEVTENVLNSVAFLEQIGMLKEFPKQMTLDVFRGCNAIYVVPQGILQLCAEQGFTLEQEDWRELWDSSYSFKTNAELAEQGYQLAVKCGLNITAPEEFELWQAVLLFKNMSSLPEEFLMMCGKCNPAIHLNKPGSLGHAENYELALQGYQKLKEYKIEIKNSGAYVYMVHDVLSNVATAPEALFALLGEADIPLDLRADWWMVAEEYSEDALWQEAYDSMQQMKKLKLDIDYDKNVTLTEVIAFYRIMDDIPTEILKQYVSKGWDIEVECHDDRNYGINYELQNSVTQELYDRALSGYKKVKKYGVSLKVLDEWEPIELVSFYAGLDLMDPEVLEGYADRGWKIQLTTLKVKKFSKEYGLGTVTAVGFCEPGEARIVMTSDNSVSNIDHTILHEMGHYYDYICRHEGYTWNSESEKFSDLYKKYKKKEKGGNDDRGYVEDILYNLEKICYREYSYTDGQEFFADSFEFYFTYPEQFKVNYPDIYEYIDNLLD